MIFEDHSAKTFNRPQWNKLLIDLRKYRGQSDLILFTKWNRFSRNAGDAYQMISTLRKIGVEPQGVEQPLDLSIPENKIMLVFYLAAPEVENDRRALNVFHGMRRAKKEGRYMGTAPLGYINKVNEAGKKYIAPREHEANILKWAFQELASGRFNTEQIWKLAREKGLNRGSKNNFWVAIRNPLYCGKIFISKFKDEESRFVQGQHEPLISEALFYDVQDVLNGRKKIQRIKLAVDERKISSMFPEKLTFDGFQYRTNRANEAITLMCLIDNKIEGKKNRTSPHFSDLSQEVIWLGLEPRTHTLKVYCSTN